MPERMVILKRDNVGHRAVYILAWTRVTPGKLPPRRYSTYLIRIITA